MSCETSRRINPLTRTVARPTARSGLALIAFGLAVASAACSSAPEPRVPDSGPTDGSAVRGDASTASQESATSPESSEGARSAGADEGRWLTDEDGRRYELMEWPKLEHNHRVLESGKVRITYGLEFEIAEETPEAFWLKVYDPNQPPPPAFASAGEGSEDSGEPGAQAWPEPVAGTSERFAFEPFDRGLPEEGQWRQGFDVADLNGDGHLDIVHGPPRKGRGVPHVFLGDGEGNWRLWKEARYPDHHLDYGDIAVADLNGDGHLDMVLAAHLRGLVAFVSDGGTGTFKAWSDGLPYRQPERHQGIAPFSSRAIELVDWNGNGRPDLLVLGEGPQVLGAPSAPGEDPDIRPSGRGVVLYLNGGDGTWERVDVERDDASFGDSLALGDFDGDGQMDFVTSSNRYGWTSIVKLGDGQGGWTSEAVDALGQKTVVRAVDTGDFNGDGTDEIVIGYTSHSDGLGWRSGVDLLDRQPDGSWARTPLVGRENHLGVWGIGVGDLGADGRLDVVAAWADGGVTLIAGTPDGFAEGASPALKAEEGSYCRGYHVELVDLDGRPGDEVVIGFAGEPGSEIMFGSQERRCAHEGALRAWRLAASE